MGHKFSRFGGRHRVGSTASSSEDQFALFTVAPPSIDHQLAEDHLELMPFSEDMGSRSKHFGSSRGSRSSMGSVDYSLLPCSFATEDKAEFLYDVGKRLLLGKEGGMEVQRNPLRAIDLLVQAARLGHMGAKWDLACCEGEGIHVALNFTKAVALYSR